MCARGDRGRPVGSIYEEALATWGVDAQMLALAEECCEAAAAAMRVLNGKGTLAEVREELVDVTSLKISLENVLGTPDEWEADIDRKRAKLASTLEWATQKDLPVDEEGA